MKNIFILLLSISSLSILAQNVGINGTGALPDASAMLDVASTTSGFLSPRMTSVQRTAIVAPAAGLLVYDTTVQNFYYFDGLIWRLLLNSTSGWALTGNTLAGTEFMGSVNAQPVSFRSNNLERMRILSNGEIVVGQTTNVAGDKFSSYGLTRGIAGYGTAGAGTSVGVYGSSISSSGYGVYGNHTSNIGVVGISTSGNGVMGLSTSGTAIIGSSSSAFGVYGSSTSLVGVYGTTTSYVGVYGTSPAATGFGVLGLNTNANGTAGVFAGNNLSYTYLTSGSGIAAKGGPVGVFGVASSAGGTGGGFTSNGSALSTLIAGSGISGTSTIFGVTGFASTSVNNTWGGYFTNGVDYAYVGGKTAGGVSRKIEGTGTVNTTVKDVNEKLVVLSAPEAPENLFQDFGQGKLVNGKVHVVIDPIFSKNIVVNENHPLRVFVQLKGDCNGVFVTNETATGFDVVELKNGTSNISFSYFITANRADELLSDGTISRYSEERFAPAMGRAKTAIAETKTVDPKELEMPVINLPKVPFTEVKTDTENK
jgi:hypothetical protein